MTRSTLFATLVLSRLRGLMSPDPALGARYRLVDEGRAIECLRCGMISYHPEDVRNLYCGYCHRFHDDDGPTS
jgi:hypothetical protein